MIDDQEYGERDQIGENEEERLNEDIKVLKLEKNSSKRYIDNVNKYYDERNRIDMSYEKYFDERDQICENDEDRLTYGI